MFTLKNLTTNEFTNLFIESRLSMIGEVEMKKKICNFVAENLVHFNLNEPWSCTISFDEEQDIIGINGDEDSLNIQIIRLVNENVIKL